MNSWYHAKSSARKWGGSPEDYLPIHDFIDSSKKSIGDVRHRSVYHHAEGTFECEERFGTTITVGRKQIPVREIAERHIIEDLGFLPTRMHYIKGMPVEKWMSGSQRREVPLSHILGDKND